MKRIWKFEIETTDNQTIGMPVGAEILTVQTQYGKPCLWALVNPDGNKEQRHIEIIGTGNPVKEASRIYIGTYQLRDGALVFHVFESTN